ncbi:hypothetical protein BKA65DRAFT_514658 [Rhexocercosporidium sp. MPI-PUGE-AT-0058]|nr:hypothetical protein BKA65DRAFT_514658 [Rhexocercosporidium sp. MPI-PUGE-AT-0058]
MPRFIVFVRATPDSEGASKPTPEILSAMGTYNASLLGAGVLLAGEGLLPSSRDSVRITLGSSPKVEEGPFPMDGLVSGWWILKVKDLQEAVEWVKKCPEGCGVLEVRRIAEMEDFGEALGEEGRKKEAEMREQVEKLAKGE